MPKTEAIESREAKHGEKMIEIKLRFWTNNIASEDGKVLPKHAWTSGVVRVERNKSHGIVPGAPRPFHSLLDVGAIVEQVLVEHGVVLHPSTKMTRHKPRRIQTDALPSGIAASFCQRVARVWVMPAVSVLL